MVTKKNKQKQQHHLQRQDMNSFLPAVSEDFDEDAYSVEDTEESVSETNDNSKDKEPELARSETRLVNTSKVFVLLVLLLVSAGFAYATYWFTEQADHDVFKSDVEDYAHEILEVSQIKARQIFDTNEAMSVTVTSYAISVDAKWPYVTINHFDQRGKRLLELSGSIYVGLMPYVSKEELGDWETWAVQNQDWIPPEAFPPYMPFGIKPKVERAAGLPEVPNTTLYAPIWQVSPIFPQFIMQDNYNPPDYDKMQQTRLLTLSQLVYNRFNGTVTSDESVWPSGIISAPIFESFEEDSKLVGKFSSVFPWHNLFKGILPDGVDGFVVVIKNTCNQTVAYRVDGSTVMFLGLGEDHVDPKFADMGYSRRFDVVDNSCIYTISVYPSQELQDSYMTDKPVIYTGIVVLVFAFTAMVFVMYDCLVQRRQDTVMTSAQRSNALVDSLFPAEFRDRLIEDAEQNKQGNNDKKAKKSTKSTEGRQNLQPLQPLYLQSSGAKPFVGTKPIADLFPNATVMFGEKSLGTLNAVVWNV